MNNIASIRIDIFSSRKNVKFVFEVFSFMRELPEVSIKLVPNLITKFIFLVKTKRKPAMYEPDGKKKLSRHLLKVPSWEMICVFSVMA